LCHVRPGILGSSSCERLQKLTFTVQPDKGGNPEIVRESQRKRGASVELVDQVMEIFAEHKRGT
jgi:hypothetical protein